MTLRRRLPILVALGIAGPASAQPVATHEARAGAAPEAPPEVLERVRHARELWKEKRFLDAAQEYQAAYDARPIPSLLFDEAQMYMAAHDCADASRYYSRYELVAPPGESMTVHGEQRLLVDLARERLRECSREGSDANLPAAPAPARGASAPPSLPPAGSPATLPAQRADERTAPASAVAARTTRARASSPASQQALSLSAPPVPSRRSVRHTGATGSVVTFDSRPSRRWYDDGWELGLGASAAAALATSGVLFALAESKIADATRQTETMGGRLDVYLADQTSAHALRVAGATALAASAALGAASAIRYFLRRDSYAERTAIAAIAGPGLAGIAAATSF